MLHGGGFALGGLDNEALLCRRWCAEYGGVSVNVDYRLAPEHKFPVPVYDSYDAVKWVGCESSSNEHLTESFRQQELLRTSAATSAKASSSLEYQQAPIWPR